ncbi:MAG: O-antigen ligase family protein [Undibacterium sp.]|nr:O-antigen ligase family protein [Opitutaceae bacterium]
MNLPPSSAGSDPVKYGRNQGARVPPYQRPLRPLEWAVLLHVGGMLTFATWGFGSGAEWVRTGLAWWGGLGILLILTFVQGKENRAGAGLRPLRWLWPLVAFNLLTLAACLSPTFRTMHAGSEVMLVKIEMPAWRPSSALPAVAVYELWLFNALYLSAFNVALVIRQRRALRGLLVFAGINALALAVFGTLQKLAHAPGLFFGLVPSPQKFFFSSFVYHNHWGSFAVLMAAASLGLAWHYARRREDRDFLHSPACTWLVCVLAVAATVPLSGSRACSLLMLILLGGALLHTLVRMIRHRQRLRESIALPLAGALAAVVLAAGAIWFVARDSIELRVAKTKEQVSTMRAQGTVGTRAVLYRDTWAMARDKLWFGWGTGSYPHVFLLYNTIKPNSDRIPIYYADAHSDWLQSVAEHGLVGTALLGLCALVPLAGLRPRHFGSPFAAYLLAGCALILLYAWVEFPFGNAAVVLSWWLVFFCAVRYARLESSAEGAVR